MIDLEKERVDLKNRGEFEHELLNRRVTWLLTSQTILFAAYGLSFGEKIDIDSAEKFRSVVPFLGIVISLVIWLGINAAFFAKVTALKDFNRKAEKVENGEKETLGVRSWITVMGYIPDFCIPLIFIYAWYTLNN